MVCDIALIDGGNSGSFSCHSSQGTARSCWIVLLALPGLTSWPFHMAMLGPAKIPHGHATAKSCLMALPQCHMAMLLLGPAKWPCPNATWPATAKSCLMAVATFCPMVLLALMALLHGHVKSCLMALATFFRPDCRTISSLATCPLSSSSCCCLPAR